MKSTNTVIVLLQFFLIAKIFCMEDCDHPNELKLKEEYCWRAEVEIIDRIHHTSKSVLNFAKKKLGIEVDDENQPQKCEYYQCIFQQLKMFNSNGYPIYEIMQKWIEDYVIFQQAKNLLDQLNICNDALSNATLANTYFDGDKLGDFEGEETLESQSKCELSAEFMKCLSRPKGCAVFQYP